MSLFTTTNKPPDTDTLLKLLRDWLQATRGNPPAFYIANAGPARDVGLRLWERTSAAISGNGRGGEAPGSAPEPSRESPSANGGASSEQERAEIGDTTPRAADMPDREAAELVTALRSSLGIPPLILTLSSSILEAIQLSDEAGGESGLSKSDILTLLDSTPSDKDWTAAIGYLIGEGKVRREGEKRGTRYFLEEKPE